MLGARFYFGVFCLLVVATTVVPILATRADDLPADLTAVELEKLLNFDLVVTLAARKEQRLSEVASAVYVLSAEDIRRSGATHIAEVLRLVPGVNVARISSNRWAISIRGFNQVFANKLLVLVDGVSIFSPTTNGVYWNSNEMDLADIERVEVIRGPGAALWGSNAVNGVINIVTKSSKDTQGWSLAAGGGSNEHALGSVRYGGKLGEQGTYRIYGLGNSRGQNQLRGGGDAQDDWQSGATGFRADLPLGSRDQVTISADVQAQEEELFPLTPSVEPPFTDPLRFHGDSSWRGTRSLVHWRHEIEQDNALDARLSYVGKELSNPLLTFQYDAITFDVQHHARLGDRHDLVYGGSFRSFYNSSHGSEGHEVVPTTRRTELGSLFVQDDLTLLPDQLHLIIGAKLELNSEIDSELMPNLRALWTPRDDLTLWSAVARAVAPPALFFEDTRIPAAAFPIEGVPLPGLATLEGNRDLEAEEVLTYELGARSEISSDLSLDLAFFYSDHDKVFSAETGDFAPAYSALAAGPVLELPLVFDNLLAARSMGGELTAEWRVSETWRLKFSYAYLESDVVMGTSNDTGDRDQIEGGSPSNQVGVQSLLHLAPDWTLDLYYRFIDRVAYGDIEQYSQLDTRLAWQARKNLEVSIVGTNLLSSAHSEGAGNFTGPPPTEIERAVYAMARWSF